MTTRIAYCKKGKTIAYTLVLMCMGIIFFSIPVFSFPTSNNELTKLVVVPLDKSQPQTLSPTSMLQGFSPLQINTQIINPSCAGQYGLLTIMAQGGQPPYNYVANGVNVTPSSNLYAGTYTITVTDALLNSGQTVVIISAPTPLNSQSCIYSPACLACNIPLSVTPAGGTPPYSIFVNGQLGNSPFLLPAGSYQVVVEDANACSLTTYVKITKPITISSGIKLKPNAFQLVKHITNWLASNNTNTNQSTNQAIGNQPEEPQAIIYPNPFQHQVTIYLKANKEVIENAVIRNIYGHTMWQLPSIETNPNQVINLYVNTWPPGVYSLDIQLKNHQIIQKKLLKQ